jgi:hypothetical protein
MSIILHNYQNSQINQLAEDTLIAGKLIPKGYVNATQMCQANKKRLDHYLENQKTKAFLEATSTVTRISGERLIIPVIGGNDKQIQGTWFHPNVANNLAQWISPTFAAWSAEVLTRVLQGDYLALTAEAQQAEAKLQEIWDRLRLSGKVTRRTLTDSIKDYCFRHDKSLNYQIFIYPNVSDCLNVALFGKKAKQLCEERQCDRDCLRDTHAEADLKNIDHVEANAMKLIDRRDVEPLEAMRQAIALYL